MLGHRPHALGVTAKIPFDQQIHHDTGRIVIGAGNYETPGAREAGGGE